MPFSAVLDANVLYPFSLRDTLLRLAELELYTPLWSDRILDEMTHSLVEHRLTDAQATSINQAIRSVFEEAEVDAGEIERLEPAMTNQAKDRHVLAADSELIVTFNLDDFAPEACEPVGVEAVHPDQFLLDLHDLAPEAVRTALEQQAADLHPPWTIDQLLDALTTAGVPRFAETIRGET
jgi:hypothetical protein